MARVFTIGKMVENTKASTGMTKSMVVGHTLGLMAESTLASGSTAKDMVKEKSSLWMEAKGKEFGRMTKGLHGSMIMETLLRLMVKEGQLFRM